MKIEYFGVLFFILINFFPCAIYAQPLDKSMSAADNATNELGKAINELEEALRSRRSCSNQNPVQPLRGGEQPGWVNNPYSLYSRDRYITAQTDLVVATIYSEAISNGTISFSENTDVSEMIVTAAHH